MPRRSATVGYSGSPRVESAGSMFDQGPSNPPRLPTGLPVNVRKSAKAIVAENPHLDHSQTEAIVRLAKMRERYLDMEREVQAAGYTTYDEKRGREVVHPLVPVLSQLGNAILSLEKAMAIAFVARSGQVKQNERRTPAVPNHSKSEKNGRVLRLA